MGFLGRLDRAIDAFIGNGQKSDPSPFNSFAFDDFSVDGRKMIRSDRDEISIYQGQLPWVSVAVDSIVRDVSSQEYFFKNANGEIIDMRRVPDEIKGPIEMGFGGLSFVQMLEYLLPNRLLAGNAYIWKTTSTAWGASRNIWDTFVPLSSENVKICLKRTGTGIEHYEIRLGDNLYRVSPDEMIHMRQSAIVSPFIGVGNITKMRLLAEGEIAAADYLNSFFVDAQKLPSLMLVDGTSIAADDLPRYAEKIREKYSRKFAYFNGRDVQVINSSLMQKDLQFLELRRDDRQAILSIFGVPLSVAGIPDENYATAIASRNTYLASTINPILRQLADDFTRQHVHKFDKNLFFSFRMHPTGDIEQISKMLQNGIISPNRASELVGEEFDLNDDSRNQYYFPSTYLPIGQTASIDTQPVAGANMADPRNVKAICDSFSKSATKPKQFQRKYLEAALKSRNTVEDRYVDAISSYFDAQGKRILENIRAFASKSTKATIDEMSVQQIYGVDEQDFSEIVRPLHTSAVQKAVSDINGITGSRVNLNLSNPFIKAAISRLGSKIVSVTETTKNEIQRLIKKAVDDGQTITELQDAIQGKFDQFQGYRARMIARTESRAAWDAGAQVAYQDIGVKTVDVIGCTEFEANSDCGRQNVPVVMMSMLNFHPNHIGVVVPSEE